MTNVTKIIYCNIVIMVVRLLKCHNIYQYIYNKIIIPLKNYLIHIIPIFKLTINTKMIIYTLISVSFCILFCIHLIKLSVICVYY